MLNNYIKIAFKVLARRKFFTFISLFGISLTLFVLIVATAMLDNEFAPRAPESRFDRVLGVYSLGLYGPHFGTTSEPGYLFLDTYLRGLTGAERISIFTSSQQLAMYHQGVKIETHLRRTDGAYWDILDFTFLEGAPFTEQDNRDARFVAVITDDMRQKLFGADKGVGRRIELDGQTFRVVGVVKPVSITRRAGFSEVWAPLRTMKSRDYERRMLEGFTGIVLARSSADFPMLRREFNERLSRFTFDDPAFNQVVAGLDTSFEAVARTVTGSRLSGRASTFRLILIVAGLLFVTLPTMNLVSINLSRIMERGPEIGVRKAFGASSRALVTQFVVENVVLTVVGGVIGFGLAAVALRMLSRLDFIPYAVFDVNLRIFLYGVGLAALFGVISGVYPAWRMSRMHPVNALRGGVA